MKGEEDSHEGFGKGMDVGQGTVGPSTSSVARFNWHNGRGAGINWTSMALCIIGRGVGWVLMASLGESQRSEQ